MKTLWIFITATVVAMLTADGSLAFGTTIAIKAYNDKYVCMSKEVKIYSSRYVGGLVANSEKPSGDHCEFELEKIDSNKYRVRPHSRAARDGKYGMGGPFMLEDFIMKVVTNQTTHVSFVKYGSFWYHSFWKNHFTLAVFDDEKMKVDKSPTWEHDRNRGYDNRVFTIEPFNNPTDENFPIIPWHAGIVKKQEYNELLKSWPDLFVYDKYQSIPWEKKKWEEKARDALECEATLISRQHVLTAAECVQQKSIVLPKRYPNTLVEDYYVILGSNSIIRDNIKFNIASFTVHPQYIYPKKASNIMVVKMAEPIPLGMERKISPVCLPQQPDGESARKPGELLQISGWASGWVNYWKEEKLENIPNEAKWSYTEIESNAVCENAPYKSAEIKDIFKFDENMICAKDGPDMCSSTAIRNALMMGGPLTWLDPKTGKTKIIGVLSHESSPLTWLDPKTGKTKIIGESTCLDDGYKGPNIYSDVVKQLKWIKESIRKDLNEMDQDETKCGGD